MDVVALDRLAAHAAAEAVLMPGPARGARGRGARDRRAIGASTEFRLVLGGRRWGRVLEVAGRSFEDLLARPAGSRLDVVCGLHHVVALERLAHAAADRDGRAISARRLDPPAGREVGSSTVILRVEVL